MEFNQLLENYAKLTVRAGVNIQQGQDLVISAPVECVEFVRIITKIAYEAGAGEVITRWSDDKISRMKYDYCPLAVFESVPKWVEEFFNGYAEKGAAFLSISASDPDVMAGVDPKKPASMIKAMHVACREYYDGMDFGNLVWCIICVPTEDWAKKVFPDLTGGKALEKLWNCIFKAVRANADNPIKSWEIHKKTFTDKIGILNKAQFDSLEFSNSLGTDIVIGLPDNHRWAGGGDMSKSGVYFFPNIPTEEVFCAPHREKVNGTVFNALPLSYNGSLIDGFSITFENGRIVDFTAETGYDTLKELIETDEGSHYLGEVALVPKNSPIREMGILFYNTLYDENAACHFAIGKSYPECIETGKDMDKMQLMEKGLNDSVTHVDFMLGTEDLKVTGVKDGVRTPIFVNGKWAEGLKSLK